MPTTLLLASPDFQTLLRPWIRRKTSIKALSGVVYTELLINYGETVHTQNVYN